MRILDSNNVFWNLDLGPDGKSFAVFPRPQAGELGARDGAAQLLRRASAARTGGEAGFRPIKSGLRLPDWIKLSSITDMPLSVGTKLGP
jgi:hypothetical protein